MLHYMKNRYREGRRQVSLVVDEGLWLSVKAAAFTRRVSVTELVTVLLEKEVGYGAGVGSGVRAGSQAEGSLSVVAGGGVGGGYAVGSSAGHGVDPLEEIA